MKIVALTTFFSGLLLLLTACKKDSAINSIDDDLTIKLADYTTLAIPSSKGMPGIGPSQSILEGTDLNLPPCIKLVQRPGFKFDLDKQKLHGSSQTFYVTLSFVNTCCANPIEVNLPPGMMITSDDGGVQNGLLIENVYFTVPPSNCNGLTDTTTIYLAVSCLNEGRSPAMHPDPLVPYNVGLTGFSNPKITTDANLLKFIEIVKGYTGLQVRDFAKNDDTGNSQTELDKAYSEIQLALWKITDGKGLYISDVKKLKKILLPFK